MTPSNAEDWPCTPYSGTNPPQIRQDPATMCIDPSDKDAVIRALRIEKNGLLCLIDGIRDDVECAHRNVQGALKQHNSERLKRGKRALENVIECIGVKP